MKIKLLRGVHDIGMVDDVVAAARGADVLCLEYVGSPKQKEEMSTALNAITHKTSYVDRFGPGELENHPNAFARIAWKLCGSNIDVICVDEEAAEGDDAAKIMSDRVGGAIGGDEMKELAATMDFDAFYRQVDNNVTRIAQAFAKRDELVASQVARWVADRKRDNLPHGQIVILQGYVHNAAPHLKEVLPEFEISEEFYNQAGIAEVAQDPYTKLLMYKLRNLQSPLKPEMIDAMLYFMIHLAEKDDVDLGTHELGESDEVRQKRQAFFDDVRQFKEDLSKMPPEELHSIVVKLVKEEAAEVAQQL